MWQAKALDQGILHEEIEHMMTLLRIGGDQLFDQNPQGWCSLLPDDDSSVWSFDDDDSLPDSLCAGYLSKGGLTRRQPRPVVINTLQQKDPNAIAAVSA